MTPILSRRNTPYAKKVIEEAFFSLYPELDRKQVYVKFDEDFWVVAAEIPGWIMFFIVEDDVPGVHRSGVRFRRLV